MGTELAAAIVATSISLALERAAAIVATSSISLAVAIAQLVFSRTRGFLQYHR